MPFQAFDQRSFVSINVFLCNSVKILMKTLRPNNMHQFIYGFSIDIKQEPQWDSPIMALV